MAEFVVRAALRSDCAEICRLVKELAKVNKAQDWDNATPQALERDGFDTDSPRFICLVISNPDNPMLLCGYAMYYPTYHAWRGKTLHLENIFVEPSFRQNGLATLLFSEIAKEACEGNFCEIELYAFSWNSPATNFYTKLGLQNMATSRDLHLWRLDRIGANNLLAKQTI